MRVDRRAASATAAATSWRPAVFGEDERGHCVVRLAEVPPEHERAARIAVANCPEDALELSGE